MSLAYICVSLDSTGFFAYLSLLAMKAAKSNGRRLFLYFFLLSSFLTLFTSNDIVILTLTPIIYYFSKNAKVDPIPFLIAEFFAANIWSVALYIGNPTNIIVAQAYNLSFVEYSKWMVLPTIAAGTLCFALLWLVFRRRIPKKFHIPKVSPEAALKSKGGAIFGSIVLACCLATLSLSSLINVPIWVITLFFASMMLGHDLLRYHIPIVHKRKAKETAYMPQIKTIISRIPWKIVPFVLGLFIMVESLSIHGWTDKFASSISAVSTNVLLAVFIMGFLSSFTSNIMNNQPMTILFTRTLQNNLFIAPAAATKGSMFALILGSNFGANLTMIGALAGIMWGKILMDKGCSISFKEFFKYGFLIMPFVIAAACLVLVVELVLWA
jgi:Na+/H+ antiporter NhaD/arsenite permease-like protein